LKIKGGIFLCYQGTPYLNAIRVVENRSMYTEFFILPGFISGSLMNSEDGIYERTDSEQKGLMPNSIECKIKPSSISNALAGRGIPGSSVVDGGVRLFHPLNLNASGMVGWLKIVFIL
jgi:hypothetical protein